jgi:hypothetical protein
MLHGLWTTTSTTRGALGGTPCRVHDSDHAGDIDISKSTSGILFYFGKSLVGWQSVKQQLVALSSCEPEYIATSTALTQALWLVRLLGDLLGRHWSCGTQSGQQVRSGHDKELYFL